jgi:hypothetical protein
VVEFYLKLKLILRIISYLTYICWEIDNFVIKSDIFKRFFICKIILKKLSCYHDNYFRYFMFGKYNGFVSKARVSACMYFLVLALIRLVILTCGKLQRFHLFSNQVHYLTVPTFALSQFWPLSLRYFNALFIILFITS